MVGSYILLLFLAYIDEINKCYKEVYRRIGEGEVKYLRGIFSSKRK